MLNNTRNMALEIINNFLDTKISDATKGLIFQELRKFKYGSKKFKKILLVQPPDGDIDLFDNIRAKQKKYENFPPYGLAVLASHLKNDCDCKIINLNDVIIDEAINTKDNEFDYNKALRNKIDFELKEFKPDLIALTCMFSQTHKSMIDVISYIKSKNVIIPICAGGVHITNSFQNLKTRDDLIRDLKDVNFIFLLEAEISFKNFILFLNKKFEIDHLSQVFFNFTKNKFLFKKISRPQGEDIDAIPDFSLLDLKKTSNNGRIGAYKFLLDPEKTVLATSLSNRGCRGQCTFCSVRNFNGKGVRGRCIESVINELKILKYEHGVNHIMWLDDDLLYNEKRSIELFNRMVQEKLDITWDASNGLVAKSCTYEVMKAAAESGCIGIRIGMESGNVQVLRDIKKPGTVKNFLDAAENLRKVPEINSGVYIMIGFPNETYQMILDTIEVCIQMDLDWYTINPLMPLPNTPVFDEMLNAGMIDGADFQKTSYVNGSFGKLKKVDFLSKDFKTVFSKNKDSIPSKEDIDDIWAYMNFHLNFVRLLEEERPEKLNQQFKWLKYINSTVSPNNVFAKYFLGYLYNKIDGVIPNKLINDLEVVLRGNKYWNERFNDFKLSTNHLKNADFSQLYELTKERQALKDSARSKDILKNIHKKLSSKKSPVESANNTQSLI